YGELATPLVRLAHRDGTFAARVLVAPEFDTNPRLLPDTPPASAMTGRRTSDEDLLAVATVTARPLRWLAIRDVLTLREQRTARSLDFFGENLDVAGELQAGHDHITVRYDFDYDLLAGDRYL